MPGPKHYSSSANALKAFKSKNLLNTFIVCNESNPSDNDFDFGNELYKLLWMAHYYLWEDFGLIRIKPLKDMFSSFFRNDNELRFKISIQNDRDSFIWIVETNATTLRVDSLINLLAEKRQKMINAYIRVHGHESMDYLSAKLAGTLNRSQPLLHNELYGEWIGELIEGDYYSLIGDSVSMSNELFRPSYSLSFYGNNACTFGGNSPDAILAKGIYISDNNIIVTDNRIVLAFVTSLDEENRLTVINRYYKNGNGGLVARDDDNLLTIRYIKKSELERNYMF